MKTKKYLIALAIFGSLAYTAQATTYTLNKDKLEKKIPKKKGKIPPNG